jgi:hypothetical protein
LNEPTRALHATVPWRASFSSVKWACIAQLQQVDVPVVSAVNFRSTSRLTEAFCQDGGNYEEEAEGGR